MFAITGIAGQVGGVVAHALLSAGRSVRAVVRDVGKGEIWSRQGCEVALPDMNDSEALQRAFDGTEGVFVLLPPNFDPSPGFPETRRIVGAIHAALDKARPDRVVCISTIGAQTRHENLLSQLGIMEHPMPHIRVLDGFNEGWIAFEHDARKGSVVLETVLRTLVERTG